MTTTGLDVFDKAVQKVNLWLKDLMGILKSHDRRRAFLALQAVLQTLRDRMATHEAFQLGAQLPMILRGYYFEGWKPDRILSKEHAKKAFLARVERRLRGIPDIAPEVAVRATFMLLSRHVTEGELEDIRSRLPGPLRELWPSERAPSRQATLGGKRPPAERIAPEAQIGRRRATARKAWKEIRSTLARARAEGVNEQDLPVLVSRRTLSGARRRKE